MKRQKIKKTKIKTEKEDKKIIEKTGEQACNK